MAAGTRLPTRPSALRRAAAERGSLDARTRVADQAAREPALRLNRGAAVQAQPNTPSLAIKRAPASVPSHIENLRC